MTTDPDDLRAFGSSYLNLRAQAPSDRGNTRRILHLMRASHGGASTKASLRRSAKRALVGLVAALVVATVCAPAAQASDGRIQSPAGELTALYVHFLDRQPDAAGWSNYMNGGLGIAADCRSGLLRATYELANSAESINRWRTVDNLVGALYAGMLDRAPDPSGFQHYVSLTWSRGYAFSVMDVAASAEYKLRLQRVCAGGATTNANVLTPDQSRGIVAGLIDSASALAKTCGVALLMKRIVPLRGVPVQAAAINAVVQLAFSYYKNNSACGATYTVLTAAAYGEMLVDNTYNVYWMLQQWDTKPHWYSPTTTHLIIRVGSDPSTGVHYYETSYTT